jgi:hypothetical protein
MALTKISFEIEVEDTFQNGNTLDTATIYELLAQVAEEEYDRQFESNKIVRRFNFKVTNDDAHSNVVNVVENSDEHGHEVTETEGDQQQPQSRRKRTLPQMTIPSGKLFLPH